MKPKWRLYNYFFVNRTDLDDSTICIHKTTNEVWKKSGRGGMWKNPVKCLNRDDAFDYAESMTTV